LTVLLSLSIGIVMKIEAFGLSDVGKKRTRNEDSFLVSDELKLYIVADGMGGHSGGEYASRLAVATMEEVISSMNTDPEATVISGVNSEETEYGDRLKYAIEVASQKIFDQALYDPDLKGMGTTITAVMIDDGNSAYVANVGDSRVYLIRDNKIEQKTVDHSLVSEQMRAGLISESDAKKHKLKNIITRSVGYQEEVEIDLVSFKLELNDRILLCSDGLTNMIDDDILLKTTSDVTDIHEACSQLVKLANENGGEDNISVILCGAAD
jgi:PPM family protein phosphatase